jgi:hypothetical protein
MSAPDKLDKGMELQSAATTRGCDRKKAMSRIHRFRGLGLGQVWASAARRGRCRRGYSRYEILQHYFPGIGFRRKGSVEAKGIRFRSPGFRFGREVTASGYPHFLKEAPAGSLFKLLVALTARAQARLIRAHASSAVGAAPKRRFQTSGSSRHGRKGFHDGRVFMHAISHRVRRIDRSDSGVC